MRFVISSLSLSPILCIYVSIYLSLCLRQKRVVSACVVVVDDDEKGVMSKGHVPFHCLFVFFSFSEDRLWV